MIGKLKESFGSFVSKECEFCGEKIEGKPVEAEVKVPGYVGKHSKYFCSQDHVAKWKNYIKKWEKNNHEIPMQGTCPTCMG
ncbi:MAG: hypothetical protein ABEK17_04405 [Candidatus Aenigmatarchaeota archaeon]